MRLLGLEGASAERLLLAFHFGTGSVEHFEEVGGLGTHTGVQVDLKFKNLLKN